MRIAVDVFAVIGLITVVNLALCFALIALWRWQERQGSAGPGRRDHAPDGIVVTFPSNGGTRSHTGLPPQPGSSPSPRQRRGRA